MSQRTSEEGQRRNELAACRMREQLGGVRRSKPRALAFVLGHTMASPEAQERSKYLNALIKSGANYIRELE